MIFFHFLLVFSVNFFLFFCNGRQQKGAEDGCDRDRDQKGGENRGQIGDGEGLEQAPFEPFEEEQWNEDEEKDEGNLPPPSDEEGE